MKSVYTLLLTGCMLFGVGISGNAQSFISVHDTISVTASGTTIATYSDSVINLTTGVINVQWKVVATNFPSDWRSVSIFCDPGSCYGDFLMWPTIPTKAFVFGAGGDLFNLGIDYSAVISTGCYYATVRMNNAAIPADTATVTYIICKYPVSVPVTSVVRDVTFYPNPVSNTLNVVFSQDADIRNIAVYNIIGRQMNLYKVTGNSRASLNVESIPAGVYFVRLLNSDGDVVATKRFTKQ